MQDTPLFDVDTMHHLQRQILLRLRQNETQTYQQLKPDGLEGNAFNYHLKQLRHANLIAAQDNLYLLTNLGTITLDAYSFVNQRLMLRPHFYIYLLVTKQDSVMVYEPNRPPNRGTLCLPSGKMHYSDSMTDSLARETKRRELTDRYTTTILCPINIRYHKKEALVMHRPGVVWHIDYRDGMNIAETTNGKSYWMTVTECAQNAATLPDLTNALERLAAQSHAPIDLQHNLG